MGVGGIYLKGVRLLGFKVQRLQNKTEKTKVKVTFITTVHFTSSLCHELECVGTAAVIYFLCSVHLCELRALDEMQ